MLLWINLFLLVAGCFLPPVAIILMTAPTLLPIIERLGFDAIWFGIVLTINMEIGLITPPVGLNLYVINGIAPDVPPADHPLGRAARSCCAWSSASCCSACSPDRALAARSADGPGVLSPDNDGRPSSSHTRNPSAAVTPEGGEFCVSRGMRKRLFARIS